MDNLTLIMFTLFFVCIGLIIFVLNFMQNKKNKKFKRTIEKLEIEKNKLATSPIVPELAKVEAFLNNDKLKELYDEWTKRLNQIKEVQIPRLSDMILDAEYALSQMDYKGATYKIAKLEMELYKVKTNSDFLFGEIRDLTSSEERNRTIITSYKARYRSLFQKFSDSKDEYGKYADVIANEFEVIANNFEIFEEMMDKNEFLEVENIILKIDELLNHIDVVIEEVPSIVLMVNNVIPKKLEEIENIYNNMVEEKYPLDYLNVEYNLNESKEKIRQVDEKTLKLDMNESLMELKVLLDYFDTLYNDLDKEKEARKLYTQRLKDFDCKIVKMNKVVDEIFDSLNEIKNIYNLNDSDMEVLNSIKGEMDKINTNYKVLQDHTKVNNTFAYTKLLKEIEGLSNELSHTEDKLNQTLNVIDSMHDDEVRARQQLEEIKIVLKDSREIIRNYNLPIIPTNYNVELKEANNAIREIVNELEKKPITIDVLNTRVDTARDLVLKLYKRTKDLVKNAKFAEQTIVYSNRFRSSDNELNNALSLSERLFYQGEYKKSFEITVNALKKIENNIYNDIINLYNNN